MKRFAIILSGCGHRDGSEITEAVSTLIAVTEAGADYKVFAPNMAFEAKNHFTGEPLGRREIMQESARIARGQVTDLKSLRADEFDGLIFPGGMGAAVHLCTWSVDGSQCTVLPEVERVVREFHSAKKPICAICIAPVIVAKVLGSEGVTVTVGDSVEVAQEIAKTGAKHKNCPVDDCIVDKEHGVVTTPAYMYDDAKPFQIFKGIRSAIQNFMTLS